MIKRKIKATSCLLSACAVLLAIIFSTIFAITSRVKAISPTEDEPAEAISAIVAKMKTNAVYECLTKTSLTSASTINGYYDDGGDGDGTLRSSLLYYVFNEKKDDVWDDENAVKVPYKLGDIFIKDGGVSCTQVFEGYDQLGGDQAYPSNVSSGKYSYIPSTTALDEAMNGLGYTYTMDNSQIDKRGCFRLEVQTNDSPINESTFFTSGTASKVNSKSAHTNYVCFNLDNNNKVVNFNTEGYSESFSHFTLQYKEEHAFVGGVKKTTPYDMTETLSINIGESDSVFPVLTHSDNSPTATYHPLETDNYSGDTDKYLSGYTSTMYPLGDYNNYETLTWDQVKQFANNWATDLQNEVMYDYSGGGWAWLNLCKEGDEVVLYPNSDRCGSNGPVSPAWSYVKVNFTEPAGGDDVGKKVWSWSQTDFSDALNYFTGMDLATAAYTDDDVYTLSLHLLKNIYGLTFVADASSDSCGNTASSTTIPVKVKSTGEIRYCQMLTLQTNVGGESGTNEDKDDGTVNAIQSAGGHTLTNMDAYGLLAAISSVDASKVTDEHIVLIDDCSANPDADGCTGGGGNSGTETPEAEEDECDPSIEANTKDVECQEKGCYKEAGSMGWIICPVIFGIHDFVDNIYDKHIAPLLSVDEGIISDLSNMDNSSATYKGWAMFRNIANILFAIVLLVVVFSQVTGFGIDNYGVKKILPKLIVTAILVNLSYIICGILVDISNMLGAGLKSLFENAAGTVTIAGVQTDSAKMTGIILNGFLVLVAGGGLAAGAMAFASGTITGWSIILPLLLIVLSAVVTVIVALIILGARQAIILILIVVSPFAFVCYALPNMNGLFKKWLRLFEAMLMVFPICGALVGGGYFASCIMLGSNSEGNVLTLIISAIVCMVPYFLIPSVTSRAMNAVGGLASRAMGMGRGLSNGIGNRARNSEAYKNRIKNSQDAARARAANRYLNSRRGRRDLAEVQAGNGNNVSRARRARLATALQNANSDYETNKGILDAAQNRDNIVSGNQQAVDEFKRGQASADLAHTVGELGAMSQSAELKRQSEHWSNQYSNTNSASDLSNEMNDLLHSDPTLSSTESKARFAAIMDRQKAINPKAYADTARNIINSGTNEAKQELQNHMRNNEEIASKFGLKQFLKEEASAGTTSQQMQDKQAGKDTKSLLAMDDDIIQSYEGLAGATGLSAEQNAIVQNMTRAADDILANPKMAEGLESKSLDTIAKIASGGTIDNWNAYKQSVSNDMITIGGENFRRSKLPSTENIDNVSGRIITYKDGSKYNADTGELTLSTPHPNPGPNPGPGTGGAP